MIKLCCEVCWINNFQQQSSSCMCLEDNCEQTFDTDAFVHILVILQRFQCTPWFTRTRCIKLLYLRCYAMSASIAQVIYCWKGYRPNIYVDMNLFCALMLCPAIASHRDSCASCWVCYYGNFHWHAWICRYLFFALDRVKCAFWMRRRMWLLHAAYNNNNNNNNYYYYYYYNNHGSQR